MGWKVVKIQETYLSKLWLLREATGEPIYKHVERALRDYLGEWGLLMLMLILVPVFTAEARVIIYSPEDGGVYTDTVEINVCSTFSSVDHLRILVRDASGNVVIDVPYYDRCAYLTPDLASGDYLLTVYEYVTSSYYWDVAQVSFTVQNMQSGTSDTGLVPPEWQGLLLILYMLAVAVVAAIPHTYLDFVEKGIILIGLIATGFALEFWKTIPIILVIPALFLVIEMLQMRRERK